MKTRSELREKCMIILYQWDLLNDDIDSIIKDNIKIKNDFVNDICNGVIKNKESIDDIANKFMKDWTINRIDKIGASILRMGIYELKYMDTPDIVVINEAINLAKKYCDEDVKNMINAILDKIIKE